MKRIFVATVLLFALAGVSKADLISGTDSGAVVGSSMTVSHVSVDITVPTMMDPVQIPGRRWITIQHSEFAGGQAWCGPKLADAVVLAGFNLTVSGQSVAFNVGPGVHIWCLYQAGSPGYMTVIQTN